MHGMTVAEVQEAIQAARLLAYTAPHSTQLVYPLQVGVQGQVWLSSTPEGNTRKRYIHRRWLRLATAEDLLCAE